MDFFSNRDEVNIEKTREILENLPPFVEEFFVGISLRTSTLTRLGYAVDLKIFFDYLTKKKFRSLKIDEITIHDIEQIEVFDIELFMEYLSSYVLDGKKLKCEKSAKLRKLSTIRSFFKYFFKRGRLSKDVSSKIEMARAKEKPIIKLEIDEIVKLLDSVESGTNFGERQNKYVENTKIRDVAILTLFLGTGIRISELVGLDKNDLFLATNSFSVTRKGGGKSILYFSDEVLGALEVYLEWRNKRLEEKGIKEGALFISLQNSRISVRATQILVKKFTSLISPLKKITPHKLRSTYGTTLYNETRDIYVVADVLGHKDINTTKKHYAAISDENRRVASRAVKLRED
ncbi:MAG: tyrosine-type recombinase/integrase [Firmicutes bacterium]|nr:tyrosine-type recombinase/integrase [Bacillota bacterium]MCL2255624.1 tyrosine-type recombinase/integrase [Bacillota bacterium]